MLRRVLTIASVLSLLLCLATALMWVRSHYVYDDHVFSHAIVYSDGGGIGYQSWPENSGYKVVPFAVGKRVTHAVIYPQPATTPPTIIQARYSQLMILFGCLPVASMLMLIHAYQVRHRRGHCRNCGYNLTGNTSGVCPECGTTLPAGVAHL
jgi:hypothetical protein